MRRAAAVATAVAWMLSLDVRAFEVETLLRTGPPDHRIDLVILGDGYRAEEQEKLTADARRILLDGFFYTSPYYDYRGLMNVKLVHVVSAESGADHPSVGLLRDTALNATFSCAGLDRLLCVDYDVALMVAAQHVPEYDHVVVLVNDSATGGSGGWVAVVSAGSEAVDILQHEFGHTLAGLADEYEATFEAYPKCDTVADCPEPNVTLRTDRSEVKWNAWIDPSTPVPTPLTQGDIYQGIGLFEGARYFSIGIYRPKYQDCIMRRSSASAFCSVCGEALIRAMWRYASPVERQVPAGATSAPACHDVAFGVATPPLTAPSWSFAWTVDGAPVAGSGPILDVPAGALTPGTHDVQVRVQDGTTRVRNDPTGLLQGTAGWQVTISACAACEANAPCGRALCVGGQARPAPVCGSSGQCGPPGESVSCGSYACDAEGVACRTQCAVPADCAPGFDCQDTRCVEIPSCPVPDSPPAPKGCSCGSGGGGDGAVAALLWLAVASAGARLRLQRRPRSVAGTRAP